MTEVDEFEALRAEHFDARGFIKKYLATDDYDYMQGYAPQDFERRRDTQDEQLQELVLNHLAVFVQCKDAIEDVYNSDKQLFTGAAMSEIVEIFTQFREEQLERLFQPILVMDSESGPLRSLLGMAQRNAAILHLPFSALTAAMGGGCDGSGGAGGGGGEDFDECVQNLRSAISFLDTSKFQRYAVVHQQQSRRKQQEQQDTAAASSSAATAAGGQQGLSSASGGGGTAGGGLTSAQLRQQGVSSFSRRQQHNSGGGAAAAATPTNNADNFDRASSSGGSVGGFSGITSATSRRGGGGAGASSLQPFEVAHRFFASWITAAEDAACFALFWARHVLAAQFTLLPHSNEFVQLMTVNQSPSSSQQQNRQTQQQQHQQQHQHTNSRRGVRLVELEDLFFQILRLVDVLAILRLERYRLLGPRAVEVADSARAASCTFTKGGANQTSRNKSSSSSSSSSARPVEVTSKEYGVGRYLAAVLGSTKAAAASSNTNNSSKNEDNTSNNPSTKTSSSAQQQQYQQLPDAETAIKSSAAFSAIFGDPRPIHPCLVYLQLFERSIHIRIRKSMRNLELEMRSVAVSTEQTEMQTSSSSSGGTGAAAFTVWWRPFAPTETNALVDSVRLVSVPPDELRTVPNRCRVLAKALLRTWTEGHRGDDDDDDDAEEEQRATTTGKSTAEISEDDDDDDEKKPLSLTAAVLGTVPLFDHTSSSSSTSSTSTAPQEQKEEGSSSTHSSWLHDKTDDDAAWFLDSCERNLGSFRCALACIAPPPSLSLLLVVTAMSSSSSSSSISSAVANNSRHTSMNVAARSLSATTSDALKGGLVSAWKRLGPMLKAGSLCRENMQWACRSGQQHQQHQHQRNKNSQQHQQHKRKKRNTGDLADDKSDDDQEHDDDQDDETVEDFLRSSAMLRRIMPRMATFSLSIPQRTLDQLGSAKSIITYRDLLVTACRHEIAGWFKIVSKLVCAMFCDLLQADLAGLFLSLASILAPTTSASAGSGGAGGGGDDLNKSRSNVMCDDGSSSSAAAAAASAARSTRSSSSSPGGGGNSTVMRKHQLIEAELAATVLRWSSVVNGVVRDVGEVQRSLASKECDRLAPEDDPFTVELTQRHLLLPLSKIFSVGLRRALCVARHVQWSPKSATWVVREMSFAASFAASVASAQHHTSSSNITSSQQKQQQRGSGNNSSTTTTTTTQTSASSTTTTTLSFSERMEAYVSKTRQSLAARFGEPGSFSASFSMASSGATPCTDFSISLVQTTTQVLTICSPLLRVVAHFDTSLCRLVLSVIADHLQILKLRASPACAALVRRTNPDCNNDVELASWLCFLSAAPFDSVPGMKDTVCSAFGFSPAAATAGGFSASSFSSTTGGGVDTSNNKTMTAGSSQQPNKPSSPASSSTAGVEYHLNMTDCSFNRCCVAEAAVGDTIAILNQVAPKIIAENVAAALVFKTATVDDAAAPWLMDVLSKENAASIDLLLDKKRDMFMDIMNGGSSNSSPHRSHHHQHQHQHQHQQHVSFVSTNFHSVGRRIVMKAYDSVLKIAEKNAQTQLDLWWAQLSKITSIADGAVKTFSGTPPPPSSSSSSSPPPQHHHQQVSGGAAGNTNILKNIQSLVDMFPHLCWTLISALRWRARVLSPILRSGEYRSEIPEEEFGPDSSSAIRVWEAVVGSSIRWLSHRQAMQMASPRWRIQHQQQQINKMEQECRLDSTTQWQMLCFRQLGQELLHLVSVHVGKSVASSFSSSSPSAVVISKWKSTLTLLIENATATSSSSSSSSKNKNNHNIGDDDANHFYACCTHNFDCDEWTAVSSSDPRSTCVTLSPETYDSFLTREMPIEYDAYKKQQRQREENNKSSNNMLMATMGPTGDNNNNNNKSKKDVEDNWWAVDSRGAERRELKLQGRREERAAAAAAAMLSVTATASTTIGGGIAASATPVTASQHDAFVQHQQRLKQRLAHADPTAVTTTANDNNDNDDDTTTAATAEPGGHRQKRVRRHHHHRRHGGAAEGAASSPAVQPRLGRIARKAAQENTLQSSVVLPSSSSAITTASIINNNNNNNSFAQNIPAAATANGLNNNNNSFSAGGGNASSLASTLRPSAANDFDNNNNLVTSTSEVKSNPFARRRHH